MKDSSFYLFSLILLIISGLNWGSVALFDFNFISHIFKNEYSLLSIYGAIGIASIFVFMAQIKSLFSKKNK